MYRVTAKREKESQPVGYEYIVSKRYADGEEHEARSNICQGDFSFALGQSRSDKCPGLVEYKGEGDDHAQEERYFDLGDKCFSRSKEVCCAQRGALDYDTHNPFCKEESDDCEYGNSGNGIQYPFSEFLEMIDECCALFAHSGLPWMSGLDLIAIFKGQGVDRIPRNSDERIINDKNIFVVDSWQIIYDSVK